MSCGAVWMKSGEAVVCRFVSPSRFTLHPRVMTSTVCDKPISGLVQNSFNARDRVAELRIVAHALLDDLCSVNDRRVVTAAELVTNSGKGCLCVDSAKVHRHLARECHCSCSAFRAEIAGPDIEKFGYGLLDRLYTEASARLFS